MPDLRYPLGPFEAPAVYSIAQRRIALDVLSELPTALRAAVAGLEEPHLDTPYRPEGWTVRQVVHHVADSHLNAYVRTRLALTEERPTIKPYDENRWAALPDARSLHVDVSLALLDALHTRWVALLRSLDEADFERTFHHPETDRTFTLHEAVAHYAWHSQHHTAHITRLRDRAGWW